MKFYSDDFESFSFENVDIGIFSGEHDSVSFVNGINTRRGGQHLDTVVHNTTYGLRELIAKRYKQIKPIDVKNNAIFIVNVRNMIAPRFDSQTKEELINTYQDFRGLYEDVEYERITKKLQRNKDFIFPIVETYRIKEELRKRRELGNKERKIKKAPVPKLIEANSERRQKCNLYIAEGMSALGNFLQCRDANFHAGFPLRGKFKSCQDVEPSVLIKNKEVADLCSIIDVKLSSTKIHNMRYGKVIILTDSDPDGDSICCGLINFFYTFWPEMVAEGRLCKAMSPLIKAKNLKTKEIRNFYSLEAWRSVNNSDWELLAYNKGLGSLDEDDYKFSLDNFITITEDEAARATLDIAFGRDSGPRKEWMIE
jgi:DNA topoisomerase-2